MFSKDNFKVKIDNLDYGDKSEYINSFHENYQTRLIKNREKRIDHYFSIGVYYFYDYYSYLCLFYY